MRLVNATLIAGMILAPVASAGAQFTTVVAPPPAQKQAVAMAAAAKAEVPRDTGHRATLQAMSAWVDSVAGTAPPTAVVTDSAAGEVALASDSATVPPTRSSGQGTTRFADGARAPNTASPLPFIIVAGLGALLLGGWLVVTGHQPAPEPVPVKPRRRAP